MGLELRVELFVENLDRFADFYTRVLGFELIDDRRREDPPYAAVRRDAVRIGAVRAWKPVDRNVRALPAGVELVLDCENVTGERDRVVAAGWSLDADLTERPWGLLDFRLYDPDGHYLRVTSRRAAAGGVARR